MNLTDDANFAEDLFCRLLNVTYGYDLKNANLDKANVATIDLVDKSKKLAVQVTSASTFKQKFIRTKNAYVKGTVFGGIKTLIVLYISSVKIPAEFIKPQRLPGRRSCQAMGIEQLLFAIKPLSPGKKKEIIGILQEEIVPDGFLPVDTKIQVDLAAFKPVKKEYEANSIYIDRPDIVSELFNLAQNTNFLVIGKPGAGKTFALKQLHQYSWENNTISVFIPVNELLNGYDDEISRLLGTDVHWLAYLKAIKGSKKCVLIFDAYDTAKEALLKKNVLVLISTAIKMLPSKWKVVVSAREYDAQKSPQLFQLFQGSHSYVPLLEEAEVMLAFKSAPNAGKIYKGSTKELKAILAIPYFLKIFIDVTREIPEEAAVELRSIHTEEQLLGFFWQQKIANSASGMAKESLLSDLSGKLYQAEKLSVDKNLVFKPENEPNIHDLMSDGILTYSGIYDRNISFAHNILFDYAIARLVIKTDIGGFIEQIKEDQKRPFIFRPSYLYYLTRLWIEYREDFWQLYRSVWEIQAPPFNIIHQAFFNYVACTSFESVEDMAPLAAMQGNQKSGLLIYRFLNAYRLAAPAELRKQDSQLVLKISEEIHIDYLWILGFFLQKCFLSKNSDKIKCAGAAIHYMSVILENRQNAGTNKGQYDYCGSSWGIKNIVAAMPYKQGAASKIIAEVLETLKEPEPFIGYFQQLTDEIDKIAVASARLAARVFTSIYLHNENAEVETYLGTGVIMGLRSNRKQDFGVCYYRLEHYLPSFLLLAPKEAIITAIGIINKLKVWRWGMPKPTFKINILGVNAKFMQDGSVGDWENEFEEGTGKLSVGVFTFLQSLLDEKKPVDEYLLLLYNVAEKSFIWKEAVKLFTKYPQTLLKDALALLQNDIFYLAPETTFETGALLEVIIPLLDSSSAKMLEERILALGSSAAAKKLKYQSSESTVQTFLSCFPETSLQTEQAKNILQASGRRTNHPIVSTGVSVDRSTPDLLDLIKTDPNSVSETEQKKRFKLLKNSVEKIEGEKGKVFSLKEARSVLRETLAISKEIRFEKGKELHEMGQFLIVKAAKVLSRGWDIYPLQMRQKCYGIAHKYLFDSSLLPPAYDPGIQSTGMRVVVPNIRVEACRAVMHLSSCNDMPGIAADIKMLIEDRDSMVRIVAASCLHYFWRNEKDVFWQLTETRLAAETDDACCAQLLHNICYGGLIRKYPGRVDKILMASASRIISKKRDNGYARHFFELVLATVQFNNSKVVKDILGPQLHDVLFSEGFISQVFVWFDRAKKDAKFKLTEYFKVTVCDLLSCILEVQLDTLSRVGVNHEISKGLFQVIDYLIQRVYFFTTYDKKNGDGHDKSDYLLFKPLLLQFLHKSAQLQDGLIAGHTGYYLIQLLENYISDDPADILEMVHQLVVFASRAGFANEQATLAIILKITEQYIVDYKELLMQDKYFEYLLRMLNVYVESGWQEAMEFIWRLNEIFE